MCSVTVVFIHTMEDDQRLNTLVYESDSLTFHFNMTRSLKFAVFTLTLAHSSTIKINSTRVAVFQSNAQYSFSVIQVCSSS